MPINARISVIRTPMKDDERRGLVTSNAMEIGMERKVRKTPLSRLLDRRWVATTTGTSILFLVGFLFLYHGRPATTTSKIKIQYECPEVIREAANVDKATFEAEYVQDQLNKTQNVTEWLQNFRKEGFDSWGHSYDEVKAGMLAFKQKYFPPNIKSGQSMYESACGIGLNLYMTLEILRDAGITGLHVYGNEYLPFSTQKANALFDHSTPGASKKGRICVGDSTDLSYVPSDSFDLVYTGYISPLLDPIELDLGSINANFVKYQRLCRAAKKEANLKEKKLILTGQEKQNDFYGKWVSEMVRIARPGSAVLVEQVSYPFCEEFLDWGGVNQEWWLPSIQHYGWDVDPTSLAFVNDTIFRHRYHVFLRKNGVKS
ncbi:hypothetical protein MHU86_8925 [Fragilaria crotonensis]|nr:hypothetical protein MHU86_8925 [Fragilaria crotonensis]